MESKEIIKNITQIYSRFEVPSNLQMHQKRVASVGALIWDNRKENPKNDEIIKEDIVAALLIHDIGNIVKFDFSEKTINILGKEAERIEHWKNVKKKIIQKYGKDDHDATWNMALELGASEGVKQLLQQVDFSRIEEVFKSNKLAFKICTYSDFRVGPFGIINLKERINDLKRRYKGRDDPLGKPECEYLYEFYYEIEKQLMKTLQISKEDINDDSIRSYFEGFSL